MKVAVLGPGGVGGLLAGALDRAGTPVVVVATESTSAAISGHGLRVDSVSFGRSCAHPRAVSRLEEPVDALIVCTKARACGPLSSGCRRTRGSCCRCSTASTT